MEDGSNRNKDIHDGLGGSHRHGGDHPVVAQNTAALPSPPGSISAPRGDPEEEHQPRPAEEGVAGRPRGRHAHAAAVMDDLKDAPVEDGASGGAGAQGGQVGGGGGSPGRSGVGGGPPPAAHYSIPGILHFLQHEWSRFEMERSQWEVEKAELQVRETLRDASRTRMTPGFCFPFRPASRSCRANVRVRRT